MRGAIDLETMRYPLCAIRYALCVVDGALIKSFAVTARCVHRGEAMTVQCEWDPSIWNSDLIESLSASFVALISKADAAVKETVGTAWLGNRPEQQPNQTGAEGEAKPGNEKGKRHESKQEGKKEN